MTSSSSRCGTCSRRCRGDRGSRATRSFVVKNGESVFTSWRSRVPSRCTENRPGHHTDRAEDCTSFLSCRRASSAGRGGLAAWIRSAPDEGRRTIGAAPVDAARNQTLSMPLELGRPAQAPIENDGVALVFVAVGPGSVQQMAGECGRLSSSVGPGLPARMMKAQFALTEDDVKRQQPKPTVTRA